MKTRLARPADVEAICRLIQIYADQGLLLPRTEEQVRKNLNHFLVLTESPDAQSTDGQSTQAEKHEPEERLLGCVALEPYGHDLSEIRSLAVQPAAQNRGLGGKLIDAALQTAKRRKIARVFAVTHAPALFERHGFAASSRQNVPEKIARDCAGCPKAQNCELVTLVAVVCPERVALPVLSPADRAAVLV
jgi:amino-acid N-acetyltransferase